jgi:hypothetical protein
MIKHATLAITGLFISQLAQAQLLNIKNAGGEVVNGQSLLVIGQPSNATLELDLVTNLNGSNAKTVNMVRYELDDCAGTQNYFCWGECWLPVNAGDNPAWDAISAVEMAPGVDNIGFHAYWKPMTTVSTCCFRFVWYDVADVNDSVFVDICFSTEPDASVNELASGVSRFDVSPNPATGGMLQFSFDLADQASDLQLVFINALGQRGLVVPAASQSSRASVDSELLRSGVWYASLESAGRRLATRRVVVAGH